MDVFLINLDTLCSQFIKTLQKQGKSKHTLAAYQNDLRLFKEFLLKNKVNIQEWTPYVNTEWFYFLQQKGRNSLASQRRAQMSMRTFVHWLITEKIITHSSVIIHPSLRQPQHDLLIIPERHYQKLTRKLKKAIVATDDHKAVRDLALIYILGECGLKASEAATLQWQHVFLSKNQGGILVPGKAERFLPLSSKVLQTLTLLKHAREKLDLPVSQDATLFYGYQNFTRRPNTPSLHRHGVKFVIYEVTFALLHTAYNPESLRNRAIFTWLKKKLPPEKVAEFAGYSSIHSLEKFAAKTEHYRLPQRRMEL